jgi:acetyl-CoA acetyltransferase family protein
MTGVYIIEGARTPFGSFLGGLKQVSSTMLGTAASKEAIKKAGVPAESIGQVVMGNVIHSNAEAAYLARHIGLYSGVPIEVPALTVNRLCGSGMQAVVSAAQSLLLNEADSALAGGAENMSMSPHADFKTRANGAKMGNISFEDMLLNTLTDAYTGNGMGITAENLSKKYEISRDAQDEYAALSHRRASEARESGRFSDEITPVETKKGVIDKDEHIRPETTENTLSLLRTSFMKDGTVTAGNSSGINDGAASLVLGNESYLSRHSAKPLAEIISWGVCGVDPSIMGIGPVPAIQQALKRANLTLEEMDLIEVNEAFSAQYLAVEKELGLDRDKTNVNGGAIALGHPVGASGARLLLTLAYELKKRKLKYGVASLCIGGGQGIAMVIKSI